MQDDDIAKLVFINTLSLDQYI